MTKVELAKLVVGTAASLGTAKIVNAIIKNNIQPAGLGNKILVGTASIVIGMYISDRIKQETNRQIDAVAEAISTDTKSVE